eukprot:5902696-Alexandrium_andersonii.AAC.1
MPLTLLASEMAFCRLATWADARTSNRLKGFWQMLAFKAEVSSDELTLCRSAMASTCFCTS